MGSALCRTLGLLLRESGRRLRRAGHSAETRLQRSKSSLNGISTRGEVYLRTLPIRGARPMMTQLERKSNTPDGWPKRLLARRDKNVAAVAPAKKNARIAWALLAHERSFHPEYIPAHAVVQ